MKDVITPVRVLVGTFIVFAAMTASLVGLILCPEALGADLGPAADAPISDYSPHATQM